MVENGKETIVNIDDEIPFDIPESWAWCRFEDLGFFMGGHTPSMKEEENWNGDIVWVSPKDMKSTIISNSILKISKKGAEKLEKIPINAILMVVRSGILRHSFPIAIAHVSCTINQDIKAFSSFLSESTLYIYNSLCSFESYIINNFTKEGTTVNSIEWDNLKRIPLPIPPLLEQKKIVAKIHESLALLKELDVNLTKTKQIILDIKSKLLDLAIRGKLLPQDENDEPASKLLERIRKEKESAQLTSKSKRKTAVSYIFKGEDNLYYEQIGSEIKCIQDEIPFDIPNSWAWTRLGSVCTLSDGEYVSNQKLPYLEAKYLRGKIEATIQTDGKFVKKGETLILVDGENSGEIFDVSENGYQGSTFKILTTVNATYKEYIYRFIAKNKELFKGSKKGSAIPHLNRKIFQELLLPLPPKEEQERISEFLTSAFTKLELLAQH